MKTRFLGSDNHSIEVSTIGLGTMGMSFAYGHLPDEQSMIPVLQGAVEMGEHFIDTAEVYGPFTNESLIGKALYPYRHDMVIATKGGIQIVNGKQVIDGRPQTLENSIEGSLKRLKVDAIDLYYLHRVDTSVPIEDVADFMGRMITAGKIKHWGLSEAGVQTIRKAHDITPLTAVESEYSLWYREPEEQLLPTLKELGIGFVPFSPLGKGFLTGAMSVDQPLSSDDVRSTLPRFKQEAMAANMKLVDVIQNFAKTKDVTNAQIALAWLLAQDESISPIPGTTKIQRIRENIDAEKVILSPTELKDLTEAADSVKIVGNRYNEELARRAGN